MFDKSNYEVRSIPFSEVKEWLLYKHYAHRIPSISFAFGLYDTRELRLVGVCTFGRPVAHSLIENAFQGEYQEQFYELNRLCVNDGLEKNTLSWFVTQCLKALPKPLVVVSYADSSQNHHGYIYQATNWLYTGLSAEFKDYMVKGFENMHSASIMDMVGRSDKNGHIDKVKLLKQRFGEDNVYMVERPRKHRYFYFLGSKSDIKHMKSLLIYPPQPYPKGDNVRYDASYQPSVNGTLF